MILFSDKENCKIPTLFGTPQSGINVLIPTVTFLNKTEMSAVLEYFPDLGRSYVMLLKQLINNLFKPDDPGDSQRSPPSNPQNSTGRL